MVPRKADSYEDTHYSEGLLKNAERNKIFLTSLETPPHNLKDASTKQDAKIWLNAITVGMKDLENFNAYEVVKIPTEHQTVSTRFVFAKKFSANTNTERY